MEILGSILDTLGNTALVRLSRFAPGAAGVAAEKKGTLQPGDTIFEPTSGNTGIGLAIAATLKGYKMICTVADKIPDEKLLLLKAYGLGVIVCPTDGPPDDPRSHSSTAERIRDEPGAFLPYQYYNQANPLAPYRTTGPEIWRQTDGSITHGVAGIGTGGTTSGTARYLKERNPKSGSSASTRWEVSTSTTANIASCRPRTGFTNT